MEFHKKKVLILVIQQVKIHPMTQLSTLLGYIFHIQLAAPYPRALPYKAAATQYDSNLAKCPVPP